MSTRAQVIIKDETDELWFYRHSDGYPDGALPTLEIFMNAINEGKIRNNVEQSAGWLVLIGAQEYGILAPKLYDGFNWKAGAYEPCACCQEHGDIEFLYTLDIVNKTIKIKDIRENKTYYADNWKPLKKAV